MVCPCCVIPTITLQLAFTALVLVYSQRWLLPTNAKIQRIGRVVSWLVAVLLIALAILLLVLNGNSSLRAKAFASFCTYMGLQASPLDDYRCPLIQQFATGSVLEFGPGPGTNFKCLDNNSQITNYVVVDPNPNFDTVLQQEKDRLNLTFPLESVGLRGEDVDVEDGRFDVVIGSHVLCSVDSPTAVLAAMSKALKPGGRYIFLEHVLASPERRVMRLFQKEFVAPILKILADGCSFLDTENLIRAQFGDDFDVTHFEAPGVPPFLTPHILGVVTKSANVE